MTDDLEHVAAHEPDPSDPSHPSDQLTPAVDPTALPSPPVTGDAPVDQALAGFREALDGDPDVQLAGGARLDRELHERLQDLGSG